jgi:hypothetical protein
VIAGNPDSVARQISDQMKQVGANHFMGMFTSAISTTTKSSFTESL